MLTILLVLLILIIIGSIIIHRLRHQHDQTQQATRRRRRHQYSSETSQVTSPSPSPSSTPVEPTLESTSQSHQQTLVESPDPALKAETTAHKTTSSYQQPDLIILHIVASENYPFMGYELLQALLGNSLRYGKYQIFHRHTSNIGHGDILFSVASSEQPGTFDLTKMGSFTCHGLTLFMQVKDLDNPLATFDLMLETAQQLAKDLSGEIYNEHRQQLSDEYTAKIRQCLTPATLITDEQTM